MGEKKQIGETILSNFSSFSMEDIAIRYKSNDQWVEKDRKFVIEQIDKIALSLVSYGIEKDDKIAIFSQNRYEWTLVDIAVMRIGAISVPIYATNTSKQAEYIVNDAQIRLLFAGDSDQISKSIEILEHENSLEKVICFEHAEEFENDSLISYNSFVKDEFSEDEKAKFQELISSVDIEDLASLIYTSGTTGEPKGVMLAHNNFISSFRIHDIRLTNIDNTDHSLCFLPLSHVFERNWTLYCFYKGIKVSYLSDPKLILETLVDVKPTVMCTVPRLYEKYYNGVKSKVETFSNLKKSIFNWSVKVGEKYYNTLNMEKSPSSILKMKKGIADKLVLNNLRVILGGKLKMTPTGGAPLSKEIQTFMRSIGIPVTMGYGLTETCASVTSFTLTQYELGSSGKLMPELELKFGDKDEILVKGPTVMKGYYNKPEATAEVFEGEWFKTGDVGQLDEGGNLFITDRLKDLIKTAGGKYVAPQLIEGILTDDNFIEQAVVIGDEKPYVTAFVVPNFEALKEYAKSLELPFKNMEELISIPKIKEFYSNKLEELQKELANFEKIKKFKLMSKEFSMEKGELTPTLKIKRKVIIAKFQNFVKDLYK